MMNEHIRQSLDQSMQDIEWKEKNREYVRNRVRALTPHTSRRKTSMILAFAAVAVLGIATALAATNEAINARLYKLWPEAAKALMPVNLTCEDQGIRMEIISAVNQGSDLLVIYTLEDLEGDRLRDSISYLSLVPEDTGYVSVSNGAVGEYDEKTRRMTYAWHEEYDRALQADGKITAKLQVIWPGQSVTVDAHPYTGLMDEPVQTASVPDDVMVSGPYAERELPDTLRILDTGSSREIPLYESVYLSGIGMIDGCLHVQIHFTDCHVAEYESHYSYPPYHAWIRLIDEQGNLLYTDDLSDRALSILRWGGEAEEGMPEWEEFFFAVDPEKVRNAEFTIQIKKQLPPILGDWEVRIPLRLIKDN